MGENAIGLSAALESDETQSPYIRAVEVVVSAWEIQQKHVSEARVRYATLVLWLFAGEVAFACFALLALGFGWWHISPWGVDAFFCWRIWAGGNYGGNHHEVFIPIRWC